MAATGAHPNILLILPDQWRGQALACAPAPAGDPNVRTPHLDRLAAGGTIVAHACTTDPVCTPARASLLTGRYPHTTGVTRNQIRLPPQEITFAEVLRSRGYATGYVGKWHLDGEDTPGFVPPGPRRHGFDYWAAFNRGHRYWGSIYFRDSPEPLHQDAYEPDYQTDLALDFIRAHRAHPFCLVLAWGPPHTPLNPPPQYAALYDAARLQVRPNVPPEEAARARQELVGYYGHCTALDAHVGRLLDELDHVGITGRTLVVFTSDHGDLLGSHGRYRKGSPLEESARVPLLLCWPDGLPAGRRAAAVAASVDLAPTLLSLCGAAAPPAVQGQDLSPVLRGESQPDGTAVYLEGRLGRADEWRAVRTRRHLLAANLDGTTTHLYDLQADPYQLRNLAGTPAAAALESDLRGHLRELGRSTGDTTIIS